MDKTLKDISWQVSEEEYRADKAYSYSTLAKFNREGFNNLYSLFDKVESPSLLFGSMVDTLLTDGQEAFDERFLVAEFPDTPDSIVKILKILFTETNGIYRKLEDITDDFILTVAVANKYQENWRPETRVKVIREKGSEYYKLLALSVGKELVSNTLYQDAVVCVDNLRSSDATKWYFAVDNPFDGIERYYQLKFKGEYEGIPVRCMMDLAIVDNTNKIIYPCDLKTSYKKEWDFYKSFIEWMYYIQAQLYWYILRSNMDKDPKFKDYKLADYRFIVISNSNRKPLVWEYVDTQVITDVVYGKNKDIICRNWRNIVKELHFYMTTGSEYPLGITTKEPNNIIKWLNGE